MIFMLIQLQIFSLTFEEICLFETVNHVNLYFIDNFSKSLVVVHKLSMHSILNCLTIYFKKRIDNKKKNI